MIISKHISLIDTQEKRQALIDAFEENKDLVKIDKFGFEYISSHDLPEKYDDKTQHISDTIIGLHEYLNLYAPTKNGVQLKYIQIRKQHGDMHVPWHNEKEWNRLDIHIPLNKTTGGVYRFQHAVISNKLGSVLMFDPNIDFWSVDKVETPHYKIVLRCSDLDPELRYTGQGDLINYPEV